MGGHSSGLDEWRRDNGRGAPSKTGANDRDSVGCECCETMQDGTEKGDDNCSCSGERGTHRAYQRAMSMSAEERENPLDNRYRSH